jgi:hypothetical protein
MRIHLAIALLVLTGTGASAQTISPNRVTIVGSDYAFIGAPTSLPPGETLFAFENRGTVRHEVNIRLLRPGVSVVDAQRAFLRQASAPGAGDAAAAGAGAPTRQVVERNVGVLLAAPGDSAGGRIYVRLIPGRSYALVCVLRDNPDSKQHIDLGMLGGFIVAEETKKE